VLLVQVYIANTGNIYRVGQKNEATLHFAEYLENYTKDIYTIFAHIKSSVYCSEYVYSVLTPGLVTLFHTVAPSGES